MEQKRKTAASSKPTNRSVTLREQQELDRAIVAELRRIQVVLPPSPGPAELRQRSEGIDRILKIREEIGPLDLTLDGLLDRNEEAND